MDAEGLLRLRPVLIELLPGLERVLVGGRALGVDGSVDQVGIPLSERFLKALAEHKGSQLGMGRDLRRGQQHIIKFRGGKINTVLIFPGSHRNGEGEHQDVQLLPQGPRDV